MEDKKYFTWKTVGYSLLIGFLASYYSRSGIYGLIGGSISSITLGYIIFRIKDSISHNKEKTTTL